MNTISASAIKKVLKTQVFANLINLSSIQISNTLLLMVLYPIIVRLIGIETFGLLMVANAFAGLTGILINYGTSQTGTRDIAVQGNDPAGLSTVFYNTILVRLLIFILFLLVFSFSALFHINHYLFYLAALPLIFAEVINPMFLFFGKENLSIYNLANMLSKVVIIVLIILLIKNSSDAPWINFYIGMVSVLTYSVLIYIGTKRFGLRFALPGKISFYQLLKQNFYLVSNNISVHLQQSIMLFILAKWGTPIALGAYSLCDKIVWSFRIVIMSVAGSIYPKSAQLFKDNPAFWKTFRNKMQLVLGALFLASSLIMFAVPGFIIHTISGEANQTAVNMLRIMAFVPAIAALNVLNTIDLLLKNEMRGIFQIAMILLFSAVGLALLVVSSGKYQWYGVYTLIIELLGLVIYQYVVRKTDRAL